MTKKNLSEVQQILAGEIGMDTQTRFHVNGDVNIYPCSWVDEQVTLGGCRKPIGRMTIEEDGTSHFKAYRSGTGPKREHLYATRHGVVEKTRPLYEDRWNNGNVRRRLDKEFVYVTFKFPKNLGLALMMQFLAEEADEVMSYLKTMNCLSEQEQNKQMFDMPSVKTVECKSKEETLWNR